MSAVAPEEMRMQFGMPRSSFIAQFNLKK